jgi:hypothetical protein
VTAAPCRFWAKCPPTASSRLRPSGWQRLRALELARDVGVLALVNDTRCDRLLLVIRECAERDCERPVFGAEPPDRRGGVIVKDQLWQTEPLARGRLNATAPPAFAASVPGPTRVAVSTASTSPLSARLIRHLERETAPL